MQTGGDQPGEVRHVGPQVGAHLVGDRPERGKVERARVGRPPGDDHLGFGVEGDLAHLVHIDAEVLFADPVEGVLVQLAREVQPHPVREVAAVGQVEAEQRLTGLHQGLQHGGVGLGTRMRLDVGEIGAEKFLGAGAGDVLDDVDVFAATVVAASRVAFGVLVGQDAALGLQHRARHEVLRRDHLQRVTLTAELSGHRSGHIGIELGEGKRIHGIRVLRHAEQCRLRPDRPIYTPPDLSATRVRPAATPE